MKLKFLALFAVLFILIGLPTISAFAQGTEPTPPATPAQVYSWVTFGGYLLAIIGGIVAAYFIGLTRNKDEAIKNAKEAIAAARNDIAGMDKLEAGLVSILKPAGVDALNFGGNALLNLVSIVLASKVDPEALSALKDYFNSTTDRKPNLPLEPPPTVKEVVPKG